MDSKYRKDTCQLERHLRLWSPLPELGRYGKDVCLRRLNIRLKRYAVEFHLQVPHVGCIALVSSYITIKVEPDDDLYTLLVLFVGDLVPAGVLADALEEKHPKTAPVAEFLRKWEQPYPNE
jgi:hypothetical protein